MTHPTRILTVALIGLIAAVSLLSLDRESLWFDEAWTVYAISAPPPATFEPPRGTRAQLTAPVKAARDDLLTTLERVRHDVHPPLYFIMLDGWVWLAGDSELSLRYPSLLLGLLAVAVMFPLTRTLFSKQAGLYAVLLFGSTPLFIYYTREARMYTLLMLLGAASTLAYVRLQRKPTVKRSALYALLIALGLYTHYTAALIVMTHGLHLIISVWRKPSPWRVIGTWVGAIITGGILFGPWVPVALAQLQANPGGALAVPVASNLAAVSALWLLLSAGWRWVYGLLLIVGLAIAIRQKRTRSGLWLIFLWLILTPALLLIVNANGFPVYQVRYTLAALPAFAILCALALTSLTPIRGDRWVVPLAAIALTGNQLIAYANFWESKPNYAEAVAQAADTRQPDELIFSDLAQRDPMHYYNERFGLTSGLAVDLSWRNHTPPEINALAERADDLDTVWMAMPVNVAKTWILAGALSRDRVITYRDGVQNMILYRFEKPSDRGMIELPLAFTFVTDDDQPVATYTGEIVQAITASTGESLCVPVELDVYQSDNNAMALTLVRGYNEVITQWDSVITSQESCIDIPADTPPGTYPLYLTIYDASTGERYPLIQDTVWWGYALASHLVMIE